jgi:hypothetical protein
MPSLRLLVAQGFLQASGANGRTTLQPTDKGLNAARRYRRMGQGERRSLRAALDRLFAAGDLEEAARLLAGHEARQPAVPALWDGAAEPPPAALKAAQAILEAGQTLDEFRATLAERQILVSQAAEIALAGQVVVDRLPELKRVLHPKGNAWLVQWLVDYGREQAVLLDQAEGAQSRGARNRDTRNRDTRNRDTRNRDTVRVPIRLKITLCPTACWP